MSDWRVVLAGAVLGGVLAVLAWIDARTLRLPDWLTLPLILLGLGEAAWRAPVELTDRAVGAAVGWAALAGIAWLYRRIRGRDGLGLGDAKLLAAGGAWLGWQLLPAVVLGSALLGLAWAGVLAARGRTVGATTAFAFGPPLCVAILAAWLWRTAVGG